MRTGSLSAEVRLNKCSSHRCLQPMEPRESQAGGNHLKMLTLYPLFCSAVQSPPALNISQWRQSLNETLRLCSKENEYRAQLMTWLFSPLFGTVTYIIKSEQLLWREETFSSSSFTFSTNWVFSIHNISKLLLSCSQRTTTNNTSRLIFFFF